MGSTNPTLNSYSSWGTCPEINLGAYFVVVSVTFFLITKSREKNLLKHTFQLTEV